jgi:hypothetical protein
MWKRCPPRICPQATEEALKCAPRLGHSLSFITRERAAQRSARYLPNAGSEWTAGAVRSHVTEPSNHPNRRAHQARSNPRQDFVVAATEQRSNALATLINSLSFITRERAAQRSARYRPKPQVANGPPGPFART